MPPRRKRLLNQFVDVRKGQRQGGEYCEDGEEQSLELFLNSQRPSSSEYNAFSVILKLKEGRIKGVSRVGHCHMCGGQGIDEELSRFPTLVLEKAARRAIENVLVTSEASHRSLSKLRGTKKDTKSHTRSDAATEKAARQEPDTALGRLRRAVISGESGTATLKITECLNEGVPEIDILNSGLLQGCDVVLQLLRAAACYVPDLLLALKACREGSVALKKACPRFRPPSCGRVAFLHLKSLVPWSWGQLLPIVLGEYGYAVSTVELPSSAVCDHVARAIRRFRGQPVCAFFCCGEPERVAPLIRELRQRGIKNTILVSGQTLGPSDIPKLARVHYFGDLLTALEMIRREYGNSSAVKRAAGQDSRRRQSRVTH